MAELIVTIRRVPGNRQTSVVVGLRSDDDTLPQEHEELHRRLVAALLPSAGVQRDRPAREAVVG